MLETIHQNRSMLVRSEEPRDMVVRTFTVRAETANEADRSVEAVLCTEAQTTVFDMRTWEPVDEVLRMDGWEKTDQVALFDSHPQLASNPNVEDDLRGSVRSIAVSGDKMTGRLFFADDPSSLNVWGKVRDKHARDLSIGAIPLEQAEIPAGETRLVKGKSYTAGVRTLFITTRWKLGEVSVTPRGADPRAKIRQALDAAPSLKEFPMNQLLRAYLEKHGLAKTADDAAALAFLATLRGDQLVEAEKLRTPAEPPAAGTTQTVRSDMAPPAPTQTQPAAVPPIQTTALPNVESVRAEAATAERKRIARMHELGGADVPAEIVRAAIDEGWDEARASREFLGAVRGARPGALNSGPGIHSRSKESDCNVRSLGMGLMLRSSLDPIKNYAEFHEGTHRPVRNADKNDDLLRAADNAWQYRDHSLVDICREACRIDSGRIPTSRAETVRAAVSGSALSAIFTTNVSAMLMQGYTDSEDTTADWCSEADVPNFQTNERAQMGKIGALTKHARGKTADHVDNSDSKESYKIARYSGQFVVDEMDIIDDRFGAIEQTSPAEMGLSARQLRPNMVYAILLSNPKLDADGVALFHATHKNLGTGALSAASVQALCTLFSKQRLNNRPLNLKPRFLLVPQDLSFDTDILLTSAQRVIAAASGGTKNPLAGMGIEARYDDRLGVAGVVDPVTSTPYAGTAANFFLVGRPGEQGAKTIEVGYLRGTGRSPQMRGFILTQGQWGVGWDVNMDIGTKALAYQAVAKSPGT